VDILVLIHFTFILWCIGTAGGLAGREASGEHWDVNKCGIGYLDGRWEGRPGWDWGAGELFTNEMKECRAFARELRKIWDALFLLVVSKCRWKLCVVVAGQRQCHARSPFDAAAELRRDRVIGKMCFRLFLLPFNGTVQFPRVPWCFEQQCRPAMFRTHSPPCICQPHIRPCSFAVYVTFDEIEHMLVTTPCARFRCTKCSSI
jgi:hypothetical protein